MFLTSHDVRFSLLPALFFSIVFGSQSYADVVSADWMSGGDGLLTRDLDNDLEWLDLRQTMAANDNRTYLDVSSELGIGGEFQGFR